MTDSCRERGPSIHPPYLDMFQRPCYSVLWAIQPYGESRISAPTSPATAAKVPVHDPAAGDSVEAQGPWRGGDGGAGTRPTDLTRPGRVLSPCLTLLEALSGVFSRRLSVRHVMSFNVCRRRSFRFPPPPSNP